MEEEAAEMDPFVPTLIDFSQIDFSQNEFRLKDFSSDDLCHRKFSSERSRSVDAGEWEEEKLLSVLML